MKTAELLDLLREAQPWIQVHAPIEATDLLMRIDAALAERQDSAKDVVEWVNPFEGPKHVAILPHATVSVLRCGSSTWSWSIDSVTIGPLTGVCTAEAEAKSAAIAAARGLK